MNYGGRDWIFDFGKHRGKTLEKMFLEDPSYITWCEKNVDGFEVSDYIHFESERRLEGEEYDYLDLGDLPY